MLGKQIAPFSDELVAKLKRYQTAGVARPYTCGACCKKMEPTREGWRCSCGWVQPWTIEPPNFLCVGAYEPGGLFFDVRLAAGLAAETVEAFKRAAVETWSEVDPETGATVHAWRDADGTVLRVEEPDAK